VEIEFQWLPPGNPVGKTRSASTRQDILGREHWVPQIHSCKSRQPDRSNHTENGYFPQSLRQIRILILEILQCIPVVKILIFLDLAKTISFLDGH